MTKNPHPRSAAPGRVFRNSFAALRGSSRGLRLAVLGIGLTALPMLEAQTLSTRGQTIFFGETPELPDNNDGMPYELGMKFQADVAGQINAIRYWRTPSEAGVHVGKIWTADGTLLASAAFVDETASGWQEVALPEPLAISADVTYTVSVNSSFYPFTGYALAAPVVNGHLRTVADGANGVFGTPGSFPSSSYHSANYFRDVAFTPALGVPVITSATSASGTVGVPFAGYTVEATNSPTSFSASGLPNGLSIDPETGVISGTPTAPAVADPPAVAGTFDVTISATNSSGTGTATLTLVIAKGAASISFSQLSQLYDGTPKHPEIVVDPLEQTDPSVMWIFDGSPTPPTEPGSYNFFVLFETTNYTASGSGTFVIQPVNPVFSVETDWKKGFKGLVLVNNVTPKRIETWSLEMDFVDREITNIWGGTIDSVSTRVEGGQTIYTYRITPPDWNKRIAPFGNVEVGFLASPGNLPPDAVRVTAASDITYSSAENATYTLPGTTVVVKKDGDWQKGAVLRFKIINNGAEKLTDWKLVMNFLRPIQSIWSATVRSVSGGTVEIDAQDDAWQKDIAAGGTVEFGLIAAPGALTELPLVTGLVSTTAPEPTPTPTPEPTPDSTPEPPSPPPPPVPSGAFFRTLLAPASVSVEKPSASVTMEVTTGGMKKIVVRAERRAKATVTGKNPYKLKISHLSRGRTKVKVKGVTEDGAILRKTINIIRH